MKTYTILILCLLIGIILIVGSCGAFSSPDTIAQNFISDVDAGNYSSLINYIHPDQPSYSSINDSFWRTDFPSGYSYSLTGVSESETSSSATVTATLNRNSNTSSIQFDFRKDGLSWKIYDILINSTSIF